MGRSKHLLSLSVSVSSWALAASLACAQQTPGSDAPVTPSSPETVSPETTPTDTAATPEYESTAPETAPMTTSPTTGMTAVMSHPGEPMVDERTRLTFPNRPLLATSSTIFVLSYLPAVIYQASEDRNKDLYIPVAGPWMDFAKGDDGRTAKTLLAIDGALQGLGALGMVSSLFIPEKRTRNWMLIGGRRSAFNLTPAHMTRSGYGLIAHGMF